VLRSPRGDGCLLRCPPGRKLFRRLGPMLIRDLKRPLACAQVALKPLESLFDV